MRERRADAVTIDVGVVQDPATSQVPQAEHGAPDPSRSPHGDTSIRWSWVAALVVVAVVVATVLGWATAASPPGAVTVSTLFLRDGVVAPDAPEHQVLRRWFHALDADATLLGIGVTEDLVIAQVATADGSDVATSTVQALARADGAPSWIRDLSDEAPATSRQAPIVVVRTTGDTPVVALAPEAGGAMDSSGIVALDAVDGSTAWRHPIQRASRVQVLTERDRAVVHYVDAARPRTEVIDLASGRVVLSDDSHLIAIPGGWLREHPDQDGAWEVLTDDGTVRTTVVSDTAPVVRTSQRGDIVIASVGTSVTATTIDGIQVWTATLPGTDPIPATDVDVDFAPVGDDMVLAGAYRASDNAVGRLEEYTTSVVSATGQVTPLDSEVVAGLARQVGLTSILVDGRPLLACASGPTSASTACPAALALVQLDGTVVARVDGVVIEPELLAPLPHFGLVTAAGIIVSEDDVLRLRRWPDLTSVWEVQLPPDAGEFLVTPTDDGLAIAHDGAQPGITWLS